MTVKGCVTVLVNQTYIAQVNDAKTPTDLCSVSTL